MKKKQIQIGFSEYDRMVADEDKIPGESLAAYVRRLIHESRNRNRKEAKRNEN